MSHISFDCNYTNQGYKCGGKVINLPLSIVQALQEIPEVIPHNKGVHQEKNTKILDFHPNEFPVLKKVTVNWVISYGDIGKGNYFLIKDFLNYLNHSHIFGMEVLVGDALKRNVHLLPIMVNFPKNSGFEEEEVDRGLSIGKWRS